MEELTKPYEGIEIGRRESQGLNIARSPDPQDHIEFITALADSVRAHWAREDIAAARKETLY